MTLKKSNFNILEKKYMHISHLNKLLNEKCYCNYLLNLCSFNQCKHIKNMTY